MSTARRLDNRRIHKKTIDKNSRLYRFNIRKKRKIKLILSRTIIIALLLIPLSIIGRTLYVNYKCKDIYYAVDYYMTSKYAKEYKLLRVKEVNLTYEDNKIAQVTASGLEDTSPHKYSSYKVSFEKTPNGYWQIDNISPVNNDK
ncbi:hypothetical protein [Clostridium sp. 'White wine YQ']|uniref:hypothetical protein n=1 Tax=Clostridium sp. 'White wine YQ' TaxID=3027474 RepID=UPI002366EC0C|nr:hypothetical protein [Clostridium sp. 'White wine YQ']MDD7792930.1 hypothetical protein [Clostridium sp. 'White wine YQ']